MHKKRKETKEWDPTRYEKESASPKGTDEYLSVATTQDGSPTGEKGKKPSSKSENGSPAPINNETKQLPIERTIQGKPGEPGPEP